MKVYLKLLTLICLTRTSFSRRKEKTIHERLEASRKRLEGIWDGPYDHDDDDDDDYDYHNIEKEEHELFFKEKDEMTSTLPSPIMFAKLKKHRVVYPPEDRSYVENPDWSHSEMSDICQIWVVSKSHNIVKYVDRLFVLSMVHSKKFFYVSIKEHS